MPNEILEELKEIKYEIDFDRLRIKYVLQKLKSKFKKRKI